MSRSTLAASRLSNDYSESDMKASLQMTEPVKPTVNTVTIVMTKAEATALREGLRYLQHTWMLARLYDAIACFDLS